MEENSKTSSRCNCVPFDYKWCTYSKLALNVQCRTVYDIFMNAAYHASAANRFQGYGIHLGP